MSEDPNVVLNEEEDIEHCNRNDEISSTEIDHNIPKPWHNSEGDICHRDRMKDAILNLLLERLSSRGRAISVRRLRRLTERLEHALYYNAECLDSYNDNSTLKRRIHLFALSNVFGQHEIDHHHQSSNSNCNCDSSSSISERSICQSDLEFDGRRSFILRQQQQRLLLLRHASRCMSGEFCRVTRHCRRMKRLWCHILACRSQTCDYEFCISSRYVLSHYSRCRSQHCAICSPVRAIICCDAERVRRHQEELPNIDPQCRTMSSYTHRKDAIIRRRRYLSHRFYNSVSRKRTLSIDTETLTGRYHFKNRRLNLQRENINTMRIRPSSLHSRFISLSSDDTLNEYDMEYLHDVSRRLSMKGCFFGTTIVNLDIEYE
jgi:hypothetical protein